MFKKHEKNFKIINLYSHSKGQIFTKSCFFMESINIGISFCGRNYAGSKQTAKKTKNLKYFKRLGSTLTRQFKIMSCMTGVYLIFIKSAITKNVLQLEMITITFCR